MDANILKQYIFQKGFITESAKLKREQEAASSTLQVCTHDYSAHELPASSAVVYTTAALLGIIRLPGHLSKTLNP